jgi:hypothetical protein
VRQTDRDREREKEVDNVYILYTVQRNLIGLISNHQSIARTQPVHLAAVRDLPLYPFSGVGCIRLCRNSFLFLGRLDGYICSGMTTC